MDVIGSGFTKAIEEITKPGNLLSHFLRPFLKEKRIYLFPLQFKRAIEGFENDRPFVSVHWYNLVQSPLTKKQAVAYLDTFPAYVEQAFPKLETTLLDSIEDTATKVLGDTARKITNHLFKTRTAMFRNRDGISRKYRKLVGKAWNEEIKLLRMIIEVSKEIHETLNSNPMVEQSFRWKLLPRFLEQGCLVASEILVLLQNGYPDAALSRWRTIHELAVVLLFLQEHGDAVFEMYLEHMKVSAYKEMNLYEAKRERLGFAPIDPDESVQIARDFEAVLVKFGKKFKEEYGWASSVLTKERIMFTDIEAHVSQDYLKPYFKMASNNIHASSKGLFFKVGSFDHDEPLLGQSLFGFDDPIQLAALALNKIAFVVLRNVDTMESTLEMLVLESLATRLLETIGDSYSVSED